MQSYASSSTHSQMYVPTYAAMHVHLYMYTPCASGPDPDLQVSGARERHSPPPPTEREREIGVYIYTYEDTHPRSYMLPSAPPGKSTAPEPKGVEWVQGSPTRACSGVQSCFQNPDSDP